MNSSNSTNEHVDKLLARMNSLKTNRPLKDKNEIALAAAVVLTEIASSDHVVDKFERTVIHNGLKSLFKLSDLARPLELPLDPGKPALERENTNFALISLLPAVAPPLLATDLILTNMGLI